MKGRCTTKYSIHKYLHVGTKVHISLELLETNCVQICKHLCTCVYWLLKKNPLHLHGTTISLMPSIPHPSSQRPLYLSPSPRLLPPSHLFTVPFSCPSRLLSTPFVAALPPLHRFLQHLTTFYRSEGPYDHNACCALVSHLVIECLSPHLKLLRCQQTRHTWSSLYPALMARSRSSALRGHKRP